MAASAAKATAPQPRAVSHNSNYTSSLDAQRHYGAGIYNAIGNANASTIRGTGFNGFA